MQLLRTPSPSGRTDAVMQIIRDHLDALGLPVRVTRRGVLRATLAARRSDTSPAVAVHADTIAALVKRLVDRHALWLPLIHRFPYGIRGLGAFAFGLSKMPWGLFLIVNLAGAAVWAVSMVLVGYAFGKVSDKVLGDTVSGLSLAMLIVFLALSWLLSRKLEQAIEADARRNP